MFIITLLGILSHLVCSCNEKSNYKNTLAIICHATSLLIFWEHRKKSHICATLLYFECILVHAIIIEKYSSSELKIYGIEICTQLDWHAVIITFQFIADLYFSLYIYLDVKHSLIVTCIQVTYSSIRHLWVFGIYGFFDATIVIFIVLKTITLLAVYIIERNDRNNFLLSSKLKDSNDSWETLFMDVKNPILIINSTEILFSNKDFSESFGVNDEFSRKIDTDSLLMQLIKDEKDLYSIVEELLTKHKSCDNVLPSECLGEFKYDEGSTSLCFEVSYKLVYGKELTQCI